MDVGQRLREPAIDPQAREDAFRRYAEQLRRPHSEVDPHLTLGERLAAVRAAADRPAHDPGLGRAVEHVDEPTPPRPTAEPVPSSAVRREPVVTRPPMAATVTGTAATPRRSGPRGRLVAVVAGAALLLLAGLGGIATRDDDAPRDTDVAGRKVGIVWAAPLLSWLRGSVEPRTRVAAPREVVDRLRLELPELRVARLGARNDARLLVLPGAGNRDGGYLRRHGLVRRAERVAEFEGGLTVVSIGQRATTVEKRARVRLGRELVRETNLRLTPRAWSALTRGQVDRRLLEGIRATVMTHTVDVRDFPRDAAAAAARAPSRSVDVVAVDGQLVGSPGFDVDAITQLLATAMPGEPVVSSDSSAPDPALRITVRLPRTAE